MVNYVNIGPWGARVPEARQWGYVPKGSISHISITYDEYVHSLSFTSKDENGNVDRSEKFGDTDGSYKQDEIDIDVEVEKLNGISGTLGTYNSSTVLTSLSFSTDKNRSYGPFGSLNGTAFSMVLKDGAIGGFHGFVGWCISSIYVNIPSETSRLVGPWGGSGGVPWAYEAKGVISRISITHDDFVHSISFTSQDEKGNLDHSNGFGKDTGTIKDEIDIDFVNEKLNGISGTIGTHNSSLIVTSLSFTTRSFSSDGKKSYGPFGTENGTAFSLPVDGFFSGFHGRCGSWLDAIGVNLKPSWTEGPYGEIMVQMGLYSKPLFD